MFLLKIKNLFKDKNDKIVIWQFPNLIFIIWMILEVTTLILSSGKLKTSISLMKDAALFTWAYLELISGVNYFRKALGLVVLVLVIIGYFS